MWPLGDVLAPFGVVLAPLGAVLAPFRDSRVPKSRLETLPEPKMCPKRIQIGPKMCPTRTQPGPRIGPMWFQNARLSWFKCVLLSIQTHVYKYLTIESIYAVFQLTPRSKPSPFHFNLMLRLSLFLSTVQMFEFLVPPNQPMKTNFGPNSEPLFNPW